MISRDLTSELHDLSKQYRVVTLTGPRQAGKTTLARAAFPTTDYVNLEDPDVRSLAQNDPRAFFRLHNKKLIIDEIQRVPELLSYIQTIVDEQNVKGQFILTGSHQLELNQAIGQSLAGRTALLQLLPLSIKELLRTGRVHTPEQYLHMGFMPQVHAEGLNPTKFYRNYFQTYVERDVRLMINLKNLSQFETFIRLCAGRIGQLLNVNGLANEVGVTSNTISHWLSILEASFVIFRLQPYYENLGKRLVKTSKLYFTDVGLAAYLIGIENRNQIFRDPLRGNLYENMVILEMLKARTNVGLDPNLYFYRDSNGNEVDVIYKRANQLVPIEIKSSETFNEHLLKGVRYFKKVAGNRMDQGFLVYSGHLCPEIEHIKIVNFKAVSKIF
jgi:predicted AAA+ superfamily ATPase